MDEITTPVVEVTEAQQKDAAQKEKWRIRQAASRLRKKLSVEGSLTDQQREQNQRNRWAIALSLLNQTKRAELNAAIEEYNWIFDLCRYGADGIRDGAVYGSAVPKTETLFRPEKFLQVIEVYARLHPPREELKGFTSFDLKQEDWDFANGDILSEPFFFKSYGLAIDTIPTVAYWDFIVMFSDFYRANRNSLVLATEPADEAVTWSAVDALVAQNRRLASLVRA